MFKLIWQVLNLGEMFNICTDTVINQWNTDAWDVSISVIIWGLSYCFKYDNQFVEMLHFHELPTILNVQPFTTEGRCTSFTIILILTACHIETISGGCNLSMSCCISSRLEKYFNIGYNISQLFWLLAMVRWVIFIFFQSASFVHF